jgi:hypothetical protein
MEDFFEASRGLWLNRRVVHHLDSQDDEAADSNLVIEPFNASDDAVEKVCKVFGIEAREANGGARFWWESNLLAEKRNADYAAIVIDVPKPEHSDQGYLLRDVGYVEKKPVLSTYEFTPEGVLTIKTRYDTNFGIERCWFVNDQIRMRVSSVQFLNGAAMTTYCTEFRCPSKADIEEIASQAKTFAQTNPL